MTVPLRLLFLLGCTAYISVFVEAEQPDGYIMIQPSDGVHVKALGKNFGLTCTAMNTGDQEDPNLRWFGPDDRLIRETSGRVFVRKISLTVLRLYVTSIKAVDAGQYRCVGSINNSEKSRNTNLSIFQEITWVDAPQTQNPPINSKALIKCVVSASPSPTVSWWIGQRAIRTGGRYTVMANGLQIDKIQESDNAIYRCFVEVPTTGDVDFRDITVEVHIPPVITRPPGAMEGIAGQEVIMNCEASGRPKPLYSWYKQGSTEPIVTGDRFTVDSEFGRLKIKPLRKEDRGIYKCEASNTVGSKQGDGNLTVLIPPYVIELYNQTKDEGQDVSLICRTEAIPSPAMSWRKVGDTEDLRPGVQPGDSRIEVKSENNNLQLIVKGLVPKDSSNYTCKAKNKVGFIAANGTITVRYKPNFEDTPMNKQYLWRNKKRNLTCLANGNPMPSWEWIHNGETIKGKFENQTHRLITIGRLSHLEIYIPFEDPESYYRDYICKAYNGLGSAEHNIYLDKARVPDQPKDASVIADTPTKATFSVDPPANTGGEPIQGYTIRYDGQILNFRLDQEMLIINLTPEKTYTFEVSARTEVGIGAPFPVTHKTKARQRPGLLVFTSERFGTEAFKYRLTWGDPETGGLPVRTFHVKYKRVKVLGNTTIVEKDLEDWIIKTVRNDNPDNTLRYYEFKNLKSNSDYVTEIEAENDLGKGAVSKFFFRTAYASAPEVSSVRDGGLTTGGIVGIVIIVLLILLVIIDVSCYFMHDWGLLMFICIHLCGKQVPSRKEPMIEEGEGKEAEEGIQGHEVVAKEAQWVAADQQVTTENEQQDEKKVPPQDEPQEPIEDDDKKPMLELEPEDKPEVEEKLNKPEMELEEAQEVASEEKMPEMVDETADEKIPLTEQKYRDDDSPVPADPAQVDLAEKTPSEKDLSNEAPPEAATATQPVAMESPTAAAGESVIE